MQYSPLDAFKNLTATNLTAFNRANMHEECPIVIAFVYSDIRSLVVLLVHATRFL